MGAAVRFKHTQVPRQQGEQARLKVVQGPDSGAVFVLTGPHASIGRGEDCDLMLSDLKASRRHAELALSPGGWSVRDLGSANGLLHNGVQTRSATVRNGDLLTFGETTLEFVAADAGTLMLVSPPRPEARAQLQAANAAFEEQRKRVRAFGAPGAAPAPGSKGKEPAGKGPLILLGLGLVAVLFLMDAEPPAPAKPKAKKDGPVDLAAYLPAGTAAVDPTTAKPAEQFFKEGFREYMAGNYLRARAQFEMVLQMAPSHQLARLYLGNCDKQIDEEIKFHLGRGKKAFDAGRLKEARGHYEAIGRILFRDQSNPNFILARDQLEQVVKEMGGKGGGS